MHIVELVAYHVRIPLKTTVRHASYTRRETDTLIVRCRLADGTEGWGEGLPRPYVTGESIDTAFEQLRGAGLTSQLAGPVDDLPAAMTLCDGLRLPGVDGAQRDSFGNSVRCAIELSLLDAVARTQDVPLSDVTALLPETGPIRQSRAEVRYSTALTASKPLKTALRALLFRAYGFRQCKVKVGVDGQDDARLLRRVRRILGRGVDLRIDANEAWRCQTLEARLEPLLPYNITALEQPVPHAAVDCLAGIRRRIPVPIMLDESLCSLSDAARAIERQTCDLFNIRLSKCGGYLNSLRLAALAQRSGLGYQLGCQVGETGILSAAGRHFACSVGGIRYLEGSFDRHLVREPLTVEDLTFGYGGRAPALPGPGLGITVDMTALERVKLREEHWSLT